MNTRLFEIIKYKTGGRQSDFANLMGWTPQYLTKLLKGTDFGIRPVLTILSALPEINARWLLFGEGEMIEELKYVDILKKMFETMMSILEIERYMPVMSPEELRNYEQIVVGNKKPDFSPDTVAKWQALLQSRNDIINAKFKAAAGRSEKSCRQKRAKK